MCHSGRWDIKSHRSATQFLKKRQTRLLVSACRTSAQHLHRIGGNHQSQSRPPGQRPHQSRALSCTPSPTTLLVQSQLQAASCWVAACEGARGRQVCLARWSPLFALCLEKEYSTCGSRLSPSMSRVVHSQPPPDAKAASLTKLSHGGKREATKVPAKGEGRDEGRGAPIEPPSRPSRPSALASLPEPARTSHAPEAPTSAAAAAAAPRQEEAALRGESQEAFPSPLDKVRP